MSDETAPPPAPQHEGRRFYREPPEPRAQRRRGIVDGGAGTVRVTIPGGDVLSFSTAGLPKASMDYLATLGLWSYLSRAGDMADAMAKLGAGEVPAPKKTELKLTQWRQAVAGAMVEACRKAGKPITHDEARTRAAEMDRGAVESHKRDPLVIKHWHKINGTAPAGASALVEAAGVTDEAAPE
ncbi:hypothetical protein [Acidocella aminolytica]|uniref:Uncharacterized protein n=1 Tax=Acidocella aminolytica 101 = DSM 11237 TaxID=1120923 RepID=A0A0D6PF37_9PROT|nr:hypothetical protein [Acidocella aminolytica]GAN79818.1 hypothetical protein Aam_030_051 [Acidocella aminolytica 101 = DSM 11237]GBQ34349.1 hypothetical protein AA11237_0723 [Acidocella aminolytica 101 = DSM 11237]SHF36316.1 hypothetical protein SAMN02746095_02982 [Acidocella aminolytica 101 = DSM 11237]